MCYSQEVVLNWIRYQRDYNVKLSIKDFLRLYERRQQGEKLLIPKSLDDSLMRSNDLGLDEVRALIEDFRAGEATRLEQELFAQRTRLADAERKLAVKATKGAADSRRIAGDKIERALGKLASLRRSDTQAQTGRIYPGSYAAVMVVEDGERKLLPMRYQCRPAGKPAFYDTKFPGTYNARRDNLDGFWRGQWGRTHGVIIATAFFENVNRHRAEGRELAAGEAVENQVLEFRPRPEQEMLVACLWSRWNAPGEPDLLSFAAITDEPPAEVAAAGHDRCIMPIKPENLDAWLQPDPERLDLQQAILDDRSRPYYEHRLAA